MSELQELKSLKGQSLSAYLHIISLLPDPENTTVYIDRVAFKSLRWVRGGGLNTLYEPKDSGNAGGGVRHIKCLNFKDKDQSGTEATSLSVPEGDNAAFILGAIDWLVEDLPHIYKVLAQHSYKTCNIFISLPINYLKISLWNSQEHLKTLLPGITEALHDPPVTSGPSDANSQALKGNIHKRLEAWLEKNMKKESPFSIVPPLMNDSRDFASFVPSLSADQGGAAKETASVLLIDRTADIGSVVKSNAHILDHVYKELCGGKCWQESSSQNSDSEEILVPASLLSEIDARDQGLEALDYSLIDAVAYEPSYGDNGGIKMPDNLDLWETLIYQDTNAALLILKRRLLDMVEAHGIKYNPKEFGSIYATQSQIESLVALARKNKLAKFKPSELATLVISSAVSISLKRGGNDVSHNAAHSRIEEEIRYATESFADSTGIKNLLGAKGRTAPSQFDEPEIQDALDTAWEQILQVIPKENPTESNLCLVKKGNDQNSRTSTSLHLCDITKQWLCENGRTIPLLMFAASMLSAFGVSIPARSQNKIQSHVENTFLSTFQALSKILFGGKGSAHFQHEQQAISRKWVTEVVDTLNNISCQKEIPQSWRQWRSRAHEENSTFDNMTLDGQKNSSALIPKLIRDMFLGHDMNYLGIKGASEDKAIGSVLGGFGRLFTQTTGYSASAIAPSSPSTSPIMAKKTIFIFVTGGITYEEVREISNLAVELAPNHTVIVGGTNIVSLPMLSRQLLA
ncbi:hypothetical protein H4219_000958 [Mycoemilia scoparia]|uniref:Uncharacterized protein n=1 Tax=Mycoemilia scoparia TaxID=417184 RepID=A0A9W8A7F3_9FUNG|nr:hypothetical protein H4219_000958 [Mycoemilia scoparia]